VATYAAGAITFMESLDPKEQWLAQNALLRRQVPDALIGWDSPGSRRS
jgi:hypothetical protein